MGCANTAKCDRCSVGVVVRVERGTVLTPVTAHRTRQTSNPFIFCELGLATRRCTRTSTVLDVDGANPDYTAAPPCEESKLELVSDIEVICLCTAVLGIVCLIQFAPQAVGQRLLGGCALPLAWASGLAWARCHLKTVTFASTDGAQAPRRHPAARARARRGAAPSLCAKVTVFK